MHVFNLLSQWVKPKRENQRGDNRREHFRSWKTDGQVQSELIDPENPNPKLSAGKTMN